ncbi:ribonuclease Y [Proteinivorax tanatarense]|uniref:Ribonuclease Y n=1 Tax=Proteinivorax tanatarense TaxID=1260629 RepID=A0AAU7VQR1_9FIRM
MSTTLIWIIIPLALLIGLGLGYLIRKAIAEAKIASAEQEAKNILSDAKREAEGKRREMILEAKEEILKLRSEFEKESKERRQEVQRLEKRVMQKEESLDRKTDSIEKREENLANRENQIKKQEEQVKNAQKEQVKELERISSLTTDEAREQLLSDVEKELQHEMAVMVKEAENQAKQDAEKKANRIISTAIQRCAADHVAESTVSVVPLPNDEMKGRIIGREGRNIRALETLTGIDLIIDDTPEAVILSGFDPVRREIARVALEKLILDGRIHPGRIEEMVNKAKKEVDNQIREEGEQATFETGVHGIHPELVKLLGRLKFRTSYGQNILKHSLEVAHLAGIMAAELNADIKLAKRGGLLHDIGKAVDHEMEGPHVAIGAELAKKYKESREVIHAIAAHHGDVEAQTVEAVIVQAADAISAARPGARRETLENYIKRLENLENIADSFEGVEKSFAIQAGREVRIMVQPDQIDDAMATSIARDITKRIEDELEYPGQIKVILIRETRVVEYAK